ncbi:unnamed protein product [Ixodes pacificus]
MARGTRKPIHLRWLRKELTSLAKVMISGRKFTFSLSTLPVRERVLSMAKMRPATQICQALTTRDHSSKMGWVLSLERKLSASLFNFCPSTWFSQPLPRTSSTRFMYTDNWRRRTCLAQMMEPATGGRSLARLMRQALLWVYCTLNFSCSASMSSLTRCISCVWYSRMAPRMWGRTKRALKREKMRNISLAFLAVPSWSLSRLVMRASTRSMRSSYLLDAVRHLLTAASQASVPSFEMSSPSTSFTFS